MESSEAAVALGMGALQGVTEFLPISSDGHLALYSWLGSVPDMSLALVVLLHGGTLLATLIVFWNDLMQLLRVTLSKLARPSDLLATDEGALIAAIGVACIPTGVIGLTLEKRVESLSATPWIVGLGFLASAVMVYSTRHRKGTSTRLGLGAAFFVGVMQGVAVLPGVSRSGLTIATAMALGMSAPAAFRFSFLMSLPVIAGATLLELGKPGVLASMNAAAWLAAFTSLVVGYLALRSLGKVLTRGHFWLFSLYLVPLGAAILLFSLLGA